MIGFLGPKDHSCYSIWALEPFFIWVLGPLGFEFGVYDFRGLGVVSGLGA